MNNNGSETRIVGLFEKLAARCWYCGVELVRGGRRIPYEMPERFKSEEDDGRKYWSGMDHIDTRRAIVHDKLFPESPEFRANSCRSCASQRRGKSLEEYRAWLAERVGSGKTKRLLLEALGATSLQNSDAAAIENIANKLAASSKYLFYVEKLFLGMENELPLNPGPAAPSVQE